MYEPKNKSKEGGDGRIGASGGKTFVKVCQVMSAVVCQPSPKATSPHLKRSRELGETFQYWGPFYWHRCLSNRYRRQSKNIQSGDFI